MAGPAFQRFARRIWCAFPVALIVLSGASALPAQQPAAPPPAVLTPGVRTEVVDSLAAQLERFYAIADTGRLIAEHLRRQNARGVYASIKNPVLFAEALS